MSAASLSKKDVVIEPGAGAGSLTIFLAKEAGQVIALEKDERFTPILKEIFQKERNVIIKNNDILKFEFSFFNYKVVGNLPYYIAPAIIRKFLERENPPLSMILVTQKEVAERMMASPPHMNLLAVSLQFYADSKIISHISRNSFWPPPGVDSSIVKINPNKNTYYLPKKFREEFFYLARTGFAHPRKQLRKNLSFLDNKKKKVVDSNPEEKIKKLESSGIDLRRRAEELSIEEWMTLVRSSLE